MLESQQNLLNNTHCLLLTKNSAILYLFVELFALEVLQNHVNRIVCLINLFQSGDIGLIDGSHNFNLILQGLFSFVSRILLLLGESLYSYHFLIHQSFSQINSCKRSFSYFFFGLKQFVEISLINFFRQCKYPLLNNTRIRMIELYSIVIKSSLKSNSIGQARSLLIRPLFPKHFKLEIKINRTKQIDLLTLLILLKPKNT